MSEHVLFGQCISFSAAQDRYAQLMSTYSAASTKVRKDFAKWYQSCGSIEKVLQGYVSEASELIGAYVSGPLYTQLLQMDIYDISEDDYYSDCLILDTVQTTAAACKKLVQAVNQAKDEEVAYRELRKESRGRMVGGGFGLGGALKGMATAGAINAVTGMGHSVVNAVGNIGSSISASNSKRSIYKDDNTFSCLCQAIIDCLSSTFFEHIRIANAHSAGCIDKSFSPSKAEALLENAKRFPDKAQRLLLDAFRQQPNSPELLQYIFQNYRSERRSVLKIANFYGVNFSDIIKAVLSREYPADAKNDEGKALAAKARILALMDEMGIQESDVLDTLECDCLERLVAGYVLDASPANTDILERFRQYDAQRNNKRTIVKKHLIWQLGSEYGVSFTPEESEKVIAQEYCAEAKANTPAAEAAKERILYKMEVMGISESATLDQLESDCLARLCTGYQAADEKTCGAMLERIHAYPAQEKMKELYLKKVQGRIEEIWSAEDGEIFDNLYLKTNIKDQAQKDAALAYIKEKGRIDSSAKYLKAVTNCTPDNIKKATAYVSWNLCMAISAAILIIIGAILLIAFHAKIYFCALPILVGCILLYSRSKLKEVWNTLTIRGTVFHSQIFSEHMPTGKTPVMPALQVCIVVLLAVSGAFLLIQANASKNVASKTPTMAAAVDATPDHQKVADINNTYDAHLQLPAENNYDSAAPAADDREQPADTQEDTDSFIYKGSSYEDILGEVADNFPAAMYALFDMTADGSPELVVKTGTSQATARYDIYSLQDNNTLYLGSLDGAYTELCPISSYYALLAVKDNGYQASLSLVVYQDGSLTSIDAYEGSSSDVDTAYEPLTFTSVRKYDASQWSANPATLNDWAFERFLNQNWTYNMVDDLTIDQRYILNYRASMLAQFGISSLESSSLDELLFFAAGYLAANDPTKLDISRKEDQLVYALPVGDATNVLIDFFGLQPDYGALDEAQDVILSSDILYFKKSPELYNPYVAIISSIEENPENRMYCDITFDLYHVVDQSLDWYDYDPFYNMTAEEAAQNASLMKIRTITEQIFCIHDGGDRFDTCWIGSFEITDS